MVIRRSPFVPQRMVSAECWGHILFGHKWFKGSLFAAHDHLAAAALLLRSDGKRSRIRSSMETVRAGALGKIALDLMEQLFCIVSQCC